MFEYCATLARIIDGDTYELEIDLGFRISYFVNVRLAGVDCPERGTDAGEAAAMAASRWFNLNLHKVRLTTEKRRDGTDKMSFARYVASIFGSDGKSLAQYLVDNGHAKWV